MMERPSFLAKWSRKEDTVWLRLILEPGQDVCIMQDKDERKDAGWLMRRVVIGLSGLCGVKCGDFLNAKEYQAFVLLLGTDWA